MVLENGKNTRDIIGLECKLFPVLTPPRLRFSLAITAFFYSTSKDLLDSRVDCRTHYKLLGNYPFHPQGNYIGAGSLYNGQWWPNQSLLLRDGGHFSSESGISGNSSIGATSIIMSANHRLRYTEDVDNGDEISYCGTPGKDGVPGPKTLLMLRSSSDGSPIRVMRSSKLESRYAPRKGLRYDGLYQIYDHKLVDERKAKYLFNLRRCPGQTPIRHTGMGARPSKVELQQWERHLELMYGSRP